jgi:hypothetical protein
VSAALRREAATLVDHVIDADGGQDAGRPQRLSRKELADHAARLDATVRFA